MEGRLLRLGEELAKTFRPKLRTHAAAAPQRTAARDSALPLAPPRHHPRTRAHYFLLLTLATTRLLQLNTLTAFSYSVCVNSNSTYGPFCILNKFLNCAETRKV